MKRIFSAILICTVILSCCTCAFAATDGVGRSSDILNLYTASAASGVNSGELKISYVVSAKKSATTIGVSAIKIYKSNGNYVTTIQGSTANGLMTKNAKTKSGTYTYKGTSGVSYYAVVTITASAGGETDNKIVTTNKAQAK